MCKTFGIWHDSVGTYLWQCDQCYSRAYFRADYFAKQYANKHVYLSSERG